jgi:hypothetical protein
LELLKCLYLSPQYLLHTVMFGAVVGWSGTKWALKKNYQVASF